MDNSQTDVAAAPSFIHSGWTSIAKKYLMAFTGAVFIMFVTGHLIGNLQFFLGQDQLNTYAAALQQLGGLLWIVRLSMLLFLSLHVWTGVRLWLENKSARPVNYAREDTVQASISSRTMIWSGLGMLAYLVYHLLHFTFLTTNPEYAGLHDSLGRHDVYSMLVMGYQSYCISGTYILAMALLAFHLNHALPSLFQSLGWNQPCVRVALKRIGTIYALLIFLGYVSMPVAVLLGCVTLPGGGH